jgi:uncharacterized protein (UPF0371 family)
VAYEAATADLKDFNLIDPFHLEAYGKTAINYNRDVEVFPVLRRILERITGKAAVYKSPTDMGVNCAGFGIMDEDVVKAASCQEIIRRFFRYSCEYAMGFVSKETVEHSRLIMEEVGLKLEERPVVQAARAAAEEAQGQDSKGNDGIYCGASLELKDGTIVSGKNSPTMHATSSLVFNAIKKLADIPDSLHLLSPAILDSIRNMKKDILAARSVSLDLEEALIALSISAATNPTAQLAMEKLKELRDCEVHVTHIPTPGDEAGLRRLGVNLTSEPNFSSKNLFIS